MHSEEDFTAEDLQQDAYAAVKQKIMTECREATVNGWNKVNLSVDRDYLFRIVNWLEDKNFSVTESSTYYPNDVWITISWGTNE